MAPWPPFPSEGNLEPVGRGHQRAVPVADFARRKPLPQVSYVQSDDGVHFRIFEDAVLDHRGRALAVLFGGLEDQLHRPGQFVAAVRKDLRRPQQYRRVRVVPAGVHVPVGRREWEAGVLEHVEGVVVGSDAEHFVGILPFDQRHDAVFAVPVAYLVHAHLLQFLDDEPFRDGRCRSRVPASRGASDATGQAVPEVPAPSVSRRA